jgi:hypothetical protein
MTLQSLASVLAKREGKKSQARIGDIRELLSAIIQLEIEVRYVGGESPLDILCITAAKKLESLERKKAKAFKRSSK